MSRLLFEERQQLKNSVLAISCGQLNGRESLH